MRSALDAARRSGNYGQFQTALAELRRLAERSPPGALGAAPGAGREARELFVELLRVVHDSVRVDARRHRPTPASAESRP